MKYSHVHGHRVHALVHAKHDIILLREAGLEVAVQPRAVPVGYAACGGVQCCLDEGLTLLLYQWDVGEGDEVVQDGAAL